MVDALCLWWEEVDCAGLGVEIWDALDRAAERPDVWFVRRLSDGRYARLAAGMCHFTTLVWLCSKEREKAEPAKPKAVDATLGNMDASLFINPWFVPTCTEY